MKKTFNQKIDEWKLNTTLLQTDIINWSIDGKAQTEDRQLPFFKRYQFNYFVGLFFVLTPMILTLFWKAMIFYILSCFGIILLLIPFIYEAKYYFKQWWYKHRKAGDD